MEDFTTIVAQVKVDGHSRSKYQFNIKVNNEIISELFLDDFIHSRARRLAIKNREEGIWPNEGTVLVWYAQLDDRERITHEVPWSPLK